MGAWDGLLARAWGLLLLLGIVALALPAASGATVRRAKLGRHYETISRVCPLPTPGHPECNRLIARSATPSIANASYLVRAAYAVGPAGGLTPDDLATAYGVAGLTGTDGAGQTVGIVDFGGDSKLPNDLNTFDSYYGLAPCTTASGCFTIVGNDGTAAGVPPDAADAAAESSMDVETVHALCQPCKIVLVEAPEEPTSLELGTAVDEAINLGADIVSNSYGAIESGPDAEDDDAADYDHPGVAILASSGDDGYDDWDEPGIFDNPEQPEAPASLPTVIAVGGTTLTLNNDGTRASETVWNEDEGRAADGTGSDPGAGGSGCSTVYNAEPWQLSLPDWRQTGCGTERLVADVSALADPTPGFDTYDSFEGGWNTGGGTSLSSPIVSALYALAGGPGGVDYPAQTLYSNLAASPSSFFDVTSGGTGVCNGKSDASATSCGDQGSTMITAADDCDGTLACNSGPGYDGPSGVGAPNGLAGFTTDHAVITSSTSVTTGTPVAFSGTSSTAPGGSTITSYAWSFGDGATATGATASHAFAVSGSYLVTLTVTDSAGHQGTATQTVTVTDAAVNPPTGGGSSGATAGSSGGTAGSSGAIPTMPPAVTTTGPASGSATATVISVAYGGAIAQRKTTLTVPLRCASTAGTRCRATIAVSYLKRFRDHGHKKLTTVVLASRTVTLQAGRVTSVAVPLGGKASSLLRTAALGATVTVSYRNVADKPVSLANRAVRLRKLPKHS
jgi:PKD repeat protein